MLNFWTNKTVNSSKLKADGQKCDKLWLECWLSDVTEFLCLTVGLITRHSAIFVPRIELERCLAWQTLSLWESPASGAENTPGGRDGGPVREPLTQVIPDRWDTLCACAEEARRESVGSCLVLPSQLLRVIISHNGDLVRPHPTATGWEERRTGLGMLRRQSGPV